MHVIQRRIASPLSTEVYQVAYDHVHSSSFDKNCLFGDILFSADEITFTGIKASASMIKNLTGADSGGMP